MSTALLDQLHKCADKNDWEAVLAAKDQIQAMTGPAAERALALHILGRAHWNLCRDAWDLTLSIKYAREAAKIDTLEGEVLRKLGVRLVTIGRFAEGRRHLHGWLSRFQSTTAVLAEVQYTFGYAARYEGELGDAERWYAAACESFEAAGNTEWVNLSRCALVQVLARQGLGDRALAVLKKIPQGGSHEAYRLKALVELLAAQGSRELALDTGELASEALLELEDPDPWELAELHLLLADLQARAGNLAEKDKHLALAMDVLRTSPRHDLYKVACMLLDYEGKEVIA